MQPPFDLAQAHRWFAVECNNEAWEIVESGDRSPEKLERALHLAHAATIHWSPVGTSVNRQRALDLLAHVYAAAGRTELALAYAQQALALSEKHGSRQTDFDRAEAFATLARCLRAAGKTGESDECQIKALAAAAALPAEDRAVLDRLMNLGD